MRTALAVRLSAALLVLPALIPAAAAEEPTVHVELSSREVPANGRLRVEIIVSGPGADGAVLEANPQGRNLIPAGGVSTSTSISIYNGVPNAEKTFTLTYLPSGKGAAEVPSFTVNIGGKTFRTEALAVTITDESEQPGSRSGSRGDDRIPAEIEVTASRKRLFLGQEVILEYRLRYRARVVDFSPQEALELVPGALVVDEPVQRRLEKVEHDGQIWNEVILFRRRLQPVKSGTLEVPPVPFLLLVEVPPRDSFEAFSLLNRRRVERLARGLSLEVLPLPEEGRPADFSGAVGSFELEATIDRSELGVGDAAAITVTVEGDGSLASASAPSLESVPDLKVFEPDKQEEGRHRRSWVFPVVPQTAGELTVPPVRWSYFDPKTAEYRTLETEPLLLAVSGEAAAPAAASAPGGGRAIRAVASDLRFIKPAVVPLPDRRDDLYRRTWFWLLVALPWVVIPVMIALGWRRERLDRSGRARERRAARRARRLLRLARQAVQRGELGEAQRTGSAALAGYVADRAHRSAQALTYHDLVALTDGAGVSAETTDRLRQVVETFDRLRYTPGGGEASETGELIDRAGSLVGALEKEWR